MVLPARRKISATIKSMTAGCRSHLTNEPNFIECFLGDGVLENFFELELITIAFIIGYFFCLGNNQAAMIFEQFAPYKTCEDNIVVSLDVNKAFFVGGVSFKFFGKSSGIDFLIKEIPDIG